MLCRNVEWSERNMNKMIRFHIIGWKCIWNLIRVLVLVPLILPLFDMPLGPHQAMWDANGKIWHNEDGMGSSIRIRLSPLKRRRKNKQKRKVKRIKEKIDRREEGKMESYIHGIIKGMKNYVVRSILSLYDNKNEIFLVSCSQGEGAKYEFCLFFCFYFLIIIFM